MERMERHRLYPKMDHCNTLTMLTYPHARSSLDVRMCYSPRS
ncbi:hypothetical protein OESDEN_13008 [Oesophagostomum dentatum]|uniref:Uncharacterized protein n=1 Tax=Oesophagostomum dentatum TaxID=61180 RepID=A0A0B1STL8_OESDE|nr:hypothetical protein OESDEN_13008 [Oesophagostomum dentatum]